MASNDHKHINQNLYNEQSYAGSKTTQWQDCCTCRGHGELCESEICCNYSTMVECCDDICSMSRDTCLNRQFCGASNAEREALCEVFDTDVRGKGLRSRVPFKSGDFVIEYIGEVLSQDAYAAHNRSKNDYILKVKITKHVSVYINSRRTGNSSRFINHSCDPNCEFVIWSVKTTFKGQDCFVARIGVFARRPIPAGVEFTVDYGDSFGDFKMGKCLCGAKNCAPAAVPMEVDQHQQQRQNQKQKQKQEVQQPFAVILTPPRSPPSLVAEGTRGVPGALVKRIKSAKNDSIILLIGAGVSTSAGISAFRGEGGIYHANDDVKKLFDYNHSILQLRENDDVSQRFTDHIRFMAKMQEACLAALPTPAHYWMKSLHSSGRLRRIYSQNIDNLDARVGISPFSLPGRHIPTLIQMHGTLNTVACTGNCGYRGLFIDEFVTRMLVKPVECLNCPAREVGERSLRRKKTNYLRPEVVLYNEVMPEIAYLSAIESDNGMRQQKTVIVMGTSLSTDGVKVLAREMGKHKRPGDVFVWVNKVPAPPCGIDFDYELKMSCDDFCKEL